MNEFEIHDGVLLKYNGTDAEVIIPDGIRRIGDAAFMYCFSLKRVILPNSVTNIGRNAFRQCEYLEYAHIPEGVTEIADSAFCGCKRLPSIRIPDSTSHLGNFLFSLCENLCDISVPSGVDHIGDSTFFHCTNLQSIRLPDSIVSIGEYAFLKCIRLQSITVPASVSTIARSAFYGCERLSVTLLGTPVCNAGDFDGVSSIIAPNLPPKIFDSPMSKRAAIRGYLENRHFFLNPKIAEAYRKYALGARTKLLPDIFANDRVAELGFYAEEKKISATCFEEEYLRPAQKENAVNCISFLLNYRNEHISEKAMERAIEKAWMKDPYNPYDMKKLWTWKKCADGTLSLTSYKGSETHVTVPPYIGDAKVSRLGKFLFAPLHANGMQKEEDIQENLQKIESVVIGANVTEVEQGAFYDCCNLQSVSVPSSVVSICSSSFLGCRRLKHICGVPGSYAEQYASEQKIPFTAAENPLI